MVDSQKVSTGSARRHSMTLPVRSATESDASAWLCMRSDLWPDGSQGEHHAEIERFLAGEAREPMEVLLAFDDGTPVGVVELSIRPMLPQVLVV